MKWSINNHEKLTSISCFTSFFNVRISLSCIQMLLIQWWKLSLDVLSYTFYESPAVFLAALSTCPTYLTDLPTWHTYLHILPDFPVWPTYLTCTPDLPIYLSLHLIGIGHVQIFCDAFFVHSCILHKSDKKSIFGKHYYRLMCKAHLCKSRKLG